MSRSTKAAMREHILDCARELFALHGLNKTTRRHIARKAGLDRASELRRHFDTKEEIYAAVVQRYGKELFADLENAVNAADTAEAKLQAFVSTRYRFIRKITVTTPAILEQGPTMFPLIIRSLREYRWKMQELLESVFRVGVDAGDFELENIELLSRAMLQSLRGMDSAMVYDGEEAGLEAAQLELVRAIVHGIRRRADWQVPPP